MPLLINRATSICCVCPSGLDVLSPQKANLPRLEHLAARPGKPLFIRVATEHSVISALGKSLAHMTADSRSLWPHPRLSIHVLFVQAMSFYMGCNDCKRDVRYWLKADLKVAKFSLDSGLLVTQSGRFRVRISGRALCS